MPAPVPRLGDHEHSKQDSPQNEGYQDKEPGDPPVTRLANGGKHECPESHVQTLGEEHAAHVLDFTLEVPYAQAAVIAHVLEDRGHDAKSADTEVQVRWSAQRTHILNDSHLLHLTQKKATF
tara:strand:+ start:3817 stop:4182 length:366 start_codon:yes stop_codon:yes gene_type:complete